MKAIEEAFPSLSRVGPDDFEPLKVLGDGCFGKVMLVRRKGTPDVFAMKSIHKDHVIKNKKVRHTKTERNVMTQLRHPFIMQLHFAFQSGGKLYLVMDYFSGGDMFFHLSRERRFSVPVCCRVSAKFAFTCADFLCSALVSMRQKLYWQ
jgi:serum/glucocorticoid-regulated kinase 2